MNEYDMSRGKMRHGRSSQFLRRIELQFHYVGCLEMVKKVWCRVAGSHKGRWRLGEVAMAAYLGLVGEDKRVDKL
jgi:hypothetical protein